MIPFDFHTFFPNRGRRTKRVLIWVQRGDYTETHTKREANWSPAGRRSQRQFSFRSGFSIKVQKSVLFLVRQKFATVNIRVWRADMQKNSSFDYIYKVFCTCASKNTVKHTQKATFWSENVIQPMLLHHFRAEQCKTHVFQHIGAETQ